MYDIEIIGSTLLTRIAESGGWFTELKEYYVRKFIETLIIGLAFVALAWIFIGIFSGCTENGLTGDQHFTVVAQ